MNIPYTSTERQRQVLTAYLRHGSYKAAAKSLGIDEGTARSRIGTMLRRNGWQNVAQAAAFYYRRTDWPE